MHKYLQKAINDMFFICRPIIRKLMVKPAVMFRIDGGTCSQLADYIIIKQLEAKGYRVLADCSWYNTADTNEESTIARPFNLDKLFNLERYERATDFQVWLYHLLFPYHPTNKDMKKNGFSVYLEDFVIPAPPCYLAGYYYYENRKIEALIPKYCSLKKAEEVLDEKNLQVYYDIVSCPKSIGVHVRRGDMAIAGGYWNPLPPEYFINICNIPELIDFNFYFFSEEPEWIKEEVLPYIDVKYRLVDNNPSYYGYKDLFLLSSCLYQVKSQGSFGEFAYRINTKKNRRLIVYDKNCPQLWKWFEE